MGKQSLISKRTSSRIKEGVSSIVDSISDTATHVVHKLNLNDVHVSDIRLTPEQREKIMGKAVQVRDTLTTATKVVGKNLAKAGKGGASNLSKAITHLATGVGTLGTAFMNPLLVATPAPALVTTTAPPPPKGFSWIEFMVVVSCLMLLGRLCFGVFLICDQRRIQKRLRAHRDAANRREQRLSQHR